VTFMSEATHSVSCGPQKQVRVGNAIGFYSCPSAAVSSRQAADQENPHRVGRACERLSCRVTQRGEMIRIYLKIV
jgi:hypothetical protein